MKTVQEAETVVGTVGKSLRKLPRELLQFRVPD